VNLLVVSTRTVQPMATCRHSPSPRPASPCVQALQTHIMYVKIPSYKLSGKHLSGKVIVRETSVKLLTSLWCCVTASSPISWRRWSTFARRALSVAGPLVWNSLPDYLRDPAVSRHFLQAPKEVSVRGVLIYAAHWTFLRRCALQIYILLTYLLTYYVHDRQTSPR